MPYNDLRKGRFSEPGRIYLITAVTAGRRHVFDSLPVARMVVVEMRLLHEMGAVTSLAFVIMPDHIHWLFMLGTQMMLSDVMRRVKGRSARQIRKSGMYRKAVWQKAYCDRALRREDDIQAVARYIVTNPLRAGLVRSVADYPLWDAIWLSDL